MTSQCVNISKVVVFWIFLSHEWRNAVLLHKASFERKGLSSVYSSWGYDSTYFMSVCLKNTQMSMENACPLEEEKKKNQR